MAPSRRNLGPRRESLCTATAGASLLVMWTTFLFFSTTALAASPTVTVKPASVTPGQLTIVRVGPLPEKTTLEVTLDGAKAPEVPCADDARYRCAIVGVPYESKPGKKEIAVRTIAPGGAGLGLHRTVSLRVKPGNFTTTKLTVAPSKVTPPEDEMARIQQEKEELAACLTNSASTPLWDGTFRLPVNDAFVTGGYGSRRMFNGELKSAHLGTDIRADEKTPVFAANAGKVALAKDMYFAGNLVVIDHGLGILTGYAHLSRIDVKVGDTVKKGQQIGMAGRTGRVTGPHLHWTFRVGDNLLDAAQAINAWRGLGWR